MEFSAQNIACPFESAGDIALPVSAPSLTPEQWTEFNGDRVVRNVGCPALIPFHPPAGVTPRGESVIVAPGGGLLVLAMEHEGFDVARQLADAGYTAYVLKYRLQPTPSDCNLFLQACNTFFQEKMANGFGQADPFLETRLAVEDLQAAIDWIGSYAQPVSGKLHLIGFSAGAKVGVDALRHADVCQQLASIGLIYFSLASPVGLAADLPPLFAVMADDDPLFSRSGFGLLEYWQSSGQKTEFHLFEQGGHGFGARRQGLPCDQWISLYLRWLATKI